MKNILFLVLIILLSAQFFSCAKDKPDNAEVLARINDYNLTLEEFQSKLSAELEMDKDFKLTREARNEFLEGIIRKELLIQEAKKLDLDKRERFIRTIERYWEATLIRDLMEMKGQDINQTILISQEEIKARYDSMAKSGKGLAPLEDLEEAIKEELKNEKKTRRLREWIDGLKKNANIEIDEELLYKD